MRPPVRRRPVAAWLLTLLFLWGSAGTPVLDGWLHATRGASPLGDAAPHECVWCRTAATPLAPDPGPPAVVPIAAVPQAATPRPARIANAGKRPLHTPPARGPPTA